MKFPSTGAFLAPVKQHVIDRRSRWSGRHPIGWLIKRWRGGHERHGMSVGDSRKTMSQVGGKADRLAEPFACRQVERMWGRLIQQANLRSSAHRPRSRYSCIMNSCREHVTAQAGQLEQARELDDQLAEN